MKKTTYSRVIQLTTMVFIVSCSMSTDYSADSQSIGVNSERIQISRSDYQLFNEADQLAKVSNLVPNPEVQEAIVKNIAQGLALSQRNLSIRKLIKTELAKQFDDQYDVLWSTLKNQVDLVNFEKILKQAYTEGVERDALFSVASRFKKLHLSLPNKFEQWNYNSEILVAWEPLTQDDDEVDSIYAYDRNLNVIALSATEAPSFPVLIVGRNERTDSQTGLVKNYPSFTQPINSMLSKSQVAAATSYNPVRMSYLRITDDHEPWFKGDAEVNMYLLTDAGTGMEIGWSGIVEDRDYYKTDLLIQDKKTTNGQYLAVKFYEEDDDDRDYNFSVEFSSAIAAEFGKLEIKMGFKADTDDDYLGQNSLIDISGLPLASPDVLSAGDIRFRFTWNNDVEYKVNAMPFYHYSSNVNKGNDWNLELPITDGHDVSYELFVETNPGLYQISTCSPLTTFNTMIRVFDRWGATPYFNVDALTTQGGCPANRYASTINNVYLNPGVYYIVVDGSRGQTGNYQLSVIKL